MDERRVIPSQDLEVLVSDGMISNVNQEQIQPNSVDLTLGSDAFSVGFTSLLSGMSEEQIGLFLESNATMNMMTEEYFLLNKGETVILPLEQEISLPAGHRAVFSTKSTAGRCGLMCSVFSENAVVQNETVDGYKGKLWIQITSLAFPFFLKRGDALVQMRVEEPTERESEEVMFYACCPPNEMCAYRAKEFSHPPIFYDAPGSAQKEKYWERVSADENGNLVLEKDRFYILKTENTVKIPANRCAEVISFDERIGTFSNHFAGFVDSAFGLDTPAGLPIVLEVMPYNSHIMIRNGSPIGRMKVMQVAGSSRILYSSSRNNYAKQGLQLAKQFS